MKTLFVDLGGTLILNDHGTGVLNKELFELLKSHKDSFQLVILSDTPYDVSQMLNDFEIAHLFHPMIITKHLFDIDKTKPETYTFACAHAGTTPTDCLFIDNDETFREAAKQAGIQSIPPTDPDRERTFTRFCN